MSDPTHLEILIQFCRDTKEKIHSSQHASLDALIESVRHERKQLTTCDLCDEPAEYRQCQKCMNDKFIGSHTDDEWDKLESETNQLKESIKKLVQLKLMTEAERKYYYKELVNLVY